MENQMKYQTGDKVPFWKNLAFALQQVFAIVTATMLVPLLSDASGVYLSQSAALIGAGVGTLCYLLLTKFRSPVFLGSSFAYIAPLATAVTFGYFGILLGAVFAGLVYVVLALVIKFAGTNWIDKLMPPIIIGPVVALIGFSLAGSAINNLMYVDASSQYNLVGILVGIFTFLMVVIISVKGPKKLRAFPFILGMLCGYALASIFTLIGIWANIEYLKLIDFSVFAKVADLNNWLPNLTIVGVFGEGVSKIGSFGDILNIFVAFAPIAFVSFAEHLADHKNLGSVIGKDLLKDPGLDRTLLGDGIGTMAGAVFGGCPNTTYGESIGCVALSRNASTRTILTASIMCIVIAFFYPFIAFIASFPVCVVGGVCIALYGFISVSGLRMLKNVDLNESKNLFVVSSIFITGIGGMFLQFGNINIPEIACALIVGIITNLVLKTKKKDDQISQDSELLESPETIETDQKEE